MENENTPEEQFESTQKAPSQLHTITPLSKYLAMALFIVLPFLGGWVGYTQAPEKIVEVKSETVEQRTSQSSQWQKTTAEEVMRENYILTEIEKKTRFDTSHLLVPLDTDSKKNLRLGINVFETNPKVTVEQIGKVGNRSVHSVKIFGEENEGEGCGVTGSHCFSLVYDHTKEEILFTDGNVIEFGGISGPDFDDLAKDYIIFSTRHGSFNDCSGGIRIFEMAYFFESKEIYQKGTAMQFGCPTESESPDVLGVLTDESIEYKIIYENNHDNFVIPTGSDLDKVKNFFAESSAE